jgi:hypothetical protein
MMIEIQCPTLFEAVVVSLSGLTRRDRVEGERKLSTLTPGVRNKLSERLR